MIGLIVYAGVVVAATKTEPGPADSTMTYTIDAYIEGSVRVLTGVFPPAYARPDPLLVDAQPMAVGEKVLLVGQWRASHFDGVISRIEGERMAFAECGA